MKKWNVRFWYGPMKNWIFKKCKFWNLCSLEKYFSEIFFSNFPFIFVNRMSVAIQKMKSWRKNMKIFDFEKILVRKIQILKKWKFFEIFARSKNIFRKRFSKLFFCFRKLHGYSYLTSCWTPSNSFWSLRTSNLHFGQKKFTL